MAGGRVRLDKWLWAARFFKTRSIAARAVAGGKVQLNGRRAKRASMLDVGDRLRIRKGLALYEVIIQELSERRGPGREAAKLYEETAESRIERERLAGLRKAAPSFDFREKGKPSKRERRQLERLKYRNQD